MRLACLGSILFVNSNARSNFQDMEISETNKQTWKTRAQGWIRRIPFIQKAPGTRFDLWNVPAIASEQPILHRKMSPGCMLEPLRCFQPSNFHPTFGSPPTSCGSRDRCAEWRGGFLSVLNFRSRFFKKKSESSDFNDPEENNFYNWLVREFPTKPDAVKCCQSDDLNLILNFLHC